MAPSVFFRGGFFCFCVGLCFCFGFFFVRLRQRLSKCLPKNVHSAITHRGFAASLYYVGRRSFSAVASSFSLTNASPLRSKRRKLPAGRNTNSAFEKTAWTRFFRFSVNIDSRGSCPHSRTPPRNLPSLCVNDTSRAFLWRSPNTPVSTPLLFCGGMKSFTRLHDNERRRIRAASPRLLCGFFLLSLT